MPTYTKTRNISEINRNVSVTTGSGAVAGAHSRSRPKTDWLLDNDRGDGHGHGGGQNPGGPRRLGGVLARDCRSGVLVSCLSWWCF